MKKKTIRVCDNTYGPAIWQEGYAKALSDAVKAVKALAEESEAISFQAPLVMVISRLEALSRGSR